MSDTVTDAYSSALAGLLRSGPRPLHPLAVNFGDDTLADGAALRAHIEAAGPDDGLCQQLHHTLAQWDHAGPEASWTAGSDPNTTGRRSVLIAALRLDTATAELFAARFPYALQGGPIVIADEWEEWRTAARRAERTFYWPHYRDHLLRTWRNGDAVADLDLATEEVVSRLADPTGRKAYQSKGLVVGYVQSGKTANFTGVAAKAIDAGYRLVIVLTGTTNMLRAQTQRRLDMELCGRENIELEISPHDTKAHEYHNDPDWIADRFLRHGGRPSNSYHPDVRRLSNHAGDYKRLQLGFSALEFERREHSKPFFDPANLFTSNARLVVAKKNATVLQALVADLGRISDRLDEIPVLLIDDESDQASVNTTNPKKWKDDYTKRTAINRLIGQLLRMMPRAQYVGYTATPYANVFIDPTDVVDIFPRDFLISLDRPVGYMGAEDFHDADTETPVEQRPWATSGERAHVRFLSIEPDDAELRRALDMFVLTGAVKLYRQRHGVATFRHHTMLVHEAVGKESHSASAQLIEILWNRANYRGPAALQQLRELYESDVRMVTEALAPDLPRPATFDELAGDIAEALRLIDPADRNASPVIIVNSDTDLEKQQEQLDFDRRPIWRILVGGNKLARGFTVEGLTVTYYRRATKQVDTLMQMGRWFGFRPYYRDLVRLYTTEELHSMFAAACRDEQFLRDQLRLYAGRTDGRPQITPRQIPPLIAQHRPDLRPTGRNKMWNAVLQTKSSPGQSLEPVAYPSAGTKNAQHNLHQWEPVFASATRECTFHVPGTGSSYTAKIATVSHHEMITILGALKWRTPDVFQPDLAWLRSLTAGQIDDWVAILPQQIDATAQRTILGHGPFSVAKRKWTETGVLTAASEPRHRNAILRIASLTTDGRTTTEPDDAADELATGRTAAMLLYPTVPRRDPDEPLPDHVENELTVAFRLVTPATTAPKRGQQLLIWTSVDPTDPRAIAVDKALAAGAIIYGHPPA